MEVRSSKLIQVFEQDLVKKPAYKSHGPRCAYNDLIVCCPICEKIIKGYGSMRVHFRWKHLPKFYDQAYCIKHKNKMCYYPNRDSYMCTCAGCCVIIAKDGSILKLPFYIDADNRLINGKIKQGMKKKWK